MRMEKRDIVARGEEDWWSYGQAVIGDDADLLPLIPAHALPIVYGNIQHISAVCRTWRDLTSWVYARTRDHRFGLLIVLMLFSEVLLSLALMTH